ncbi:MAG: formate dehydrogenase accessory sulfurtransferase FdhD [Candidatus Bathyarchaeota archaeon]|nr:formate dehydrogenase accessory sulfurtransferase FdhD [Candidatus Bathyarchaeota archaeon]
MVEVEIVKLSVSRRQVQRLVDCVAEEKPLFIFINKAHFATVMCSPSRSRELIVGHLLSSRIVKSTEEIAETMMKGDAVQVTLKKNVDLEKRLKFAGTYSRIILSACGSSTPYQYSGKLPKIKSDLKVKAETILKGVKQLNFIAETFRKTGGVHAAAIYKHDGGLLASAEDVGRHNAVDKVVGSVALSKGSFSECFLALSGRLTSDIVIKAVAVGLPVVASLAAALDSGIRVAQEAGLTLIGFARGDRMNIYTFPERILP